MIENKDIYTDSSFKENYGWQLENVEVFRKPIEAKGKFDFVVTEKTKLLWRGTKIELSDLKEGQTISITAAQEVLLRYPAGLTGVTKVIVLDDEL